MLNLDQQSGARQAVFETIAAHKERGVLFAYIAAPPRNLLGQGLVRDLVTLLQQTEADDSVHVIVFRSADPDYFISQVDATQTANCSSLGDKPNLEPSLAILFRNLSASRLVTIAQIEGRVCGTGCEFVLACDMRFAAREFAIFGQPEARLGVIPGLGLIQQLTRLIGRGRALEVLMSADDYDARAAEHYGWVNRALPGVALGSFVQLLAHRIGGFPPSTIAAIKECVNTIALPSLEDLGHASTRLHDCIRINEAQHQIADAMKPSPHSRGAEMDQMLRNLDTES